MKSPADLPPNAVHYYEVINEVMIDLPWVSSSLRLTKAAYDGDMVYLSKVSCDLLSPHENYVIAWLPFHYACAGGHVRCIDFFLNLGVSLEQRTRKGLTPLMIACMCGKERAARYLIEKGADIHARQYNGNTVAMAACMGRLEQFTMRLLDLGVVANPAPPRRENLLNLAIMMGQEQLAEYLLASAKKQGDAALHALLNEQCGRSYSPLLSACRSGLEDMALKLISLGADVHACNNRGDNALILLCANRFRDMPRLCRALLDLGFDPCSSGYGRSAWSLACLCGHRKTVQLLLAAGAADRVKQQAESDAWWLSRCPAAIRKLLKM